MGLMDSLTSRSWMLLSRPVARSSQRLCTNVPSKLRACARARTTLRLVRTTFSYWRTIGRGHECYCSRGKPMRARLNKIRGNIVVYVERGTPLAPSIKFQLFCHVSTKSYYIDGYKQSFDRIFAQFS